MSIRTWSAFVLCVVSVPSLAARAQPNPAVRQVAVEEKVGARLSPSLALTTAQGRGVTLEGLVKGRQIPVLLVLAYARCTMLCDWVLQGVSQALPQLAPLQAGRDYLPVLVSIDPRESAEQAASKQRALLERARVSGGPDAFPFLRGSSSVIELLSGDLGFHFAWDARTQQYAHPAVIFVLTPELRISRYLYGVQFPKKELARALQDARAGRTIPTAERAQEASALLRCFRYLTGAQRHAAQLLGYFRIAGVLILAGLAWLFWALVSRGRRRAP